MDSPKAHILARKSLCDFLWPDLNLSGLKMVRLEQRRMENPWRIDWRKLRQIIKNKLSSTPNGNAGTIDEMESKSEPSEKHLKFRVL